MEMLKISAALLLTMLVLTVPTFSPLIIVAAKNESKFPFNGVVPQKSKGSSHQYGIRLYRSSQNAEKIIGGGNYISNGSSTISGVKCRFRFLMMKKGNVWIGHGTFNGRKFAVDSSFDYGVDSNGQTYYRFSGIIGVRHKENFSIYILENGDGSYSVEFQILRERILKLSGTTINGKIRFIHHLSLQSLVKGRICPN